jgi:LacI family transcriptional regulator
VGALHALHANGLSAPRDMSVIAVHDMALASHLGPALTTVRMPLAELGRRALRLLAQHGPDEAIAEVVAAPLEVVVRDSTASPAA